MLMNFTKTSKLCNLLIRFFNSFSQMVETCIYCHKAQFRRNSPNLLRADGYGVWCVGKSWSRSSSSLIVFVRSLKGTFHWRLRARDHRSLKSLIGGKYQDSPYLDVFLFWNIFWMHIWHLICRWGIAFSYLYLWLLRFNTWLPLLCFVYIAVEQCRKITF